MISIVTPLFNKSAYIEKCINSVLNQTFKDFEVIVVNDGSSDDGLEKLKKIADPRITLINQPNSGVSAARNKGVVHARYNFIAFLDADDWWEPTYLEEMRLLLEDYPEAGIYGSSYYLVKNGRKLSATIGLEPDFRRGIINYCQVYAKTLCMPLWTGATIIKKSIFESENGFNPILKLGEDFDLWIRVALKFPVAFLNRTLSNYNQDLALADRAVGNLQQTATHMLWNLNYLENEEHSNPDLKLLLDKLRLYNLFPYYISKEYHLQAKRELAKVAWRLQRPIDKLKYSLPVWLLKIWDRCMFLGSRIKQTMIRSAIKFNK